MDNENYNRLFKFKNKGSGEELIMNLNSNYFDTTLPFEERVEDLLSKMTLKEKMSQMRYKSPAILRLNIPEYNWWNECLHGVAGAGIATVFPQAIGFRSMI